MGTRHRIIQRLTGLREAHEATRKQIEQHPTADWRETLRHERRQRAIEIELAHLLNQTED